VGDLDKSYAFYRDAFGFDIKSTAQIKKPAPASAAILKLTNSPDGTYFRNITVYSPGVEWYLEFTEFTNVQSHAAKFRLQDPGASYLRLRVRDIDKAVAAALKDGGSINSVGGQVMTMGKNKVVMLKDPDGFFVEVTQPDAIPATAPADSMVVGGNFVMVVQDADKAANFYKAQLGLDTQVVGWNSNESTMKMFGTPGAQMHRASIFVPGTKLQLEFIQFKDIATNKPMNLRIADPGCSQLGLQVQDIDAAAAAFVSNGGSIETAGGITKRPNGGGGGFVRDLNGFLVELNQVAPPAATTASK
jgi:catechol 2,3-dioxygenase-like lactoylglutathione lyase family enzyme/uncharacterized glyoxalase superfamily protein PhnB